MRDALLCVGGGQTLYVGTLDDVDWHCHAMPAFVAGMLGPFELRLPGTEWRACRAAIIPAGLCHSLRVGGEPVAVFYPEPNVGRLPHLRHFGRSWNVRGHTLITRHAEIGVFREICENRASASFVADAIDDLVHFTQRREGSPALDARWQRVLERLRQIPYDLTSAATLAAAEGLSVSRFLHLFSAEIGVPFRRFRIWNRVRAATHLALAGRTITDAALSAGFTNSAHFARLNRSVFGVCPSYIIRKVARTAALGCR